MSILARQLFQLQELELALEGNEQSQVKIGAQLGESQDVVKARARRDAEQKHIEELAKQQKTTEWEIEDLTVKIKAIEKKLYEGRIFNSKELSSLQAEAEDFKKRCSGLEDKALEVMDQTDVARKALSKLAEEVALLEARWQDQQKQLRSELEQLKTNQVDLEGKKQAMLTQIETGAVEIYRDLRKRKSGIAVARIEQGTCKGCRITLPNSDLQQAKGSGLVRCSSCGRILYLP
jgi:predicted  nucleic acid-binding Zn-ribbon protein